MSAHKYVQDHYIYTEPISPKHISCQSKRIYCNFSLLQLVMDTDQTAPLVSIIDQTAPFRVHNSLIVNQTHYRPTVAIYST